MTTLLASDYTLLHGGTYFHVWLQLIPPQGGDRRGVHVTRGGKGKHHWIVLPMKYQAGTDQSQQGY
ncbi:TPA: hypothetical protein EYN98_34400 [Candidatus Poribacteria bacterium]|nr:hypothetical protein [Candidatus Poribacteria bacterium]